VTDVARLLDVVESDAPFAERLAAAARLAEIGDPRATRHEPVPIGGVRIDRYPVTVALYAAFVRSEGYRARAHWSDEGWAWKAAEKVDRPRFWDDPEWAAYLAPNKPVVGVSFHEAAAYARFAGARLPTEAEWERAAGGATYPWGDEWRDDACGERGSGPRGTVPIGMYPRGRSPLGVADLAGSVWQWCTDVHPDADGGVARATRGGAWNVLRWSLRTASRNPFPSGARFSNLGFRCCWDGG
jgi:iron(II)-dependent oxidoreductase